MIVIIHLQRGIPSKRKSSTCIDYVPEHKDGDKSAGVCNAALVEGTHQECAYSATIHQIARTL